METYANWCLKLHYYNVKAGGEDCATNHCSAAAVMTLAVGELAWCSCAEEIIKTVYKVEHMERDQCSDYTLSEENVACCSSLRTDKG